MRFSECDLVKGSAYFILLYADECLSVPVIQTLIFREKCQRGNKAEFHFMEVKSDNEGSLFVVEGEHLEELVVDLSGLVERLTDQRT